MHQATEAGNNQDAHRSLSRTEGLPTARLPAQQLLLCSQGQGGKPTPGTSHSNCGGRMAYLWIPQDHRTAEQAGLAGQPQARVPFHVPNGHPEGQKVTEKDHNQQPAPVPTLPKLDSRHGYHPSRSSVGIRGWNLSRGLDQRLTLIALRRALQNQPPQIHHSDQGWQYVAKEYVELLQKAGVQISMSETGEPTQN